MSRCLFLVFKFEEYRYTKIVVNRVKFNSLILNVVSGGGMEGIKMFLSVSSEMIRVA